MIKQPFEQWLFEDVELAFGIQPIKNMPALVEWVRVSEKKILPPYIEKLRISLEEKVKVWNEDELKMLFIAPFLLYFDFDHFPHYRVFTQRRMSIKTETVDSSGRVEWMIATGKQRPKKPFFFLQEYKPEKNSGNDPLGQLLVAMVNAQSHNDHADKPIFGCYVIGQFWYFVLLKDKGYGVSRAYDATRKGGIYDIMVILNKVEHYVKQELNLLPAK